ncbi:MAG: D-aminoacylase [Spartobacteria bacterium]|nr:D-aminoacylase [Spartobacteria bacterium]
MIDLLIKNVLLLDGSGDSVVKGGIAVRGDRIVDVGAGVDDCCDAECVIDGQGAYAAPGFIDVHSHSDAFILLEPSAESKITQGVTTEVVGQCGASAAPLLPLYKMPSDWRNLPYPGTWSTLGEYRSLLDQVQPAVNIAMFTGHNALRAGVVGYADHPLSHDEQRTMQRVLEQAMDEGSLGLSTGLLYPPGCFAPIEEVIDLAKIVAKYNGIYATHMRNEGDSLLEALDETLHIVRSAGLKLQISHLKTAGKRNWHKLNDVFGKIESAQAEGVSIRSDRYPYTASCTDLDVLLPSWVFKNGPQAALECLNDASMRSKMAEEINRERDADYWEGVLIGNTLHPSLQVYKGTPLLTLAEIWNLDPVETLFRVLLLDRSKTSGIFFGMSEDNMWKILAKPWVMIGSDASLRATTGFLAEDHPHPRAYGSTAGFLASAIAGKTVSLPEAVRKMTSMPANHFQLGKRGRLKAGYVADICLFTQEVAARTTYAQPHQLAEGITTVVVNGRVAVSGGRQTRQRAGQFIART